MIFSLSNLFGLHKVPAQATGRIQDVTFSYQGKHSGGNGQNSFRRLGANCSPFGGNILFHRSASTTLLESTPFALVTKRSTGLTLGDILPQIPQEILSKVTLPQNQPLHFAQSILEEALRHPETAIPLFEVFRACPRIFKTSISHQDSRRVSIPAHMLAYVSKSIQERNPSDAEPLKGSSPFQIAKDVVCLLSRPFTERENLGNHYQMVLPVKKVTKRVAKPAPALTKIPERVQQTALEDEVISEPQLLPVATRTQNVRPKRRLCTVSHMDSHRKTKLAAIMEQYALANC